MPSDSETLIPLAEEFTSVQGEGHWAGCPTRFIRLAGCNVGQRRDPDSPYELCRAWDGRQFVCDTDFRLSRREPLDRVMEGIPDGYRVCITGGEPLIHPRAVMGIVTECEAKNIRVSIETSGTREFPPGLWSSAWITCSPKRGCRDDVLKAADELKLLVDPGFRIAEADALVAKARPGCEVYLQPVNWVDATCRDTLERCLAILKERPRWRLSQQQHKEWNVR